VDLNGTKAAIRASILSKPPAVAASQGNENLQNPKIRKVIRKLIAERNTRTLVAADRVIGELEEIAFDTQNFETRNRL
jgi:phage terminase small subunit